MIHSQNKKYCLGLLVFFYFLSFAQLVHAGYLTSPLSSYQVTSLFDHDGPTLVANSTFVRYDGAQWLGAGLSPSSCVPGVNCYDGHNGMDLVASLNTNVFAAAPGYVQSLTYDTCAGNTLRVWHSSVGYSTLYAHVLPPFPTLNTNVNRFQVIALSGGTGITCSTGPHLHFGIRDAQTGGQNMDPYGWSPTPSAPVQIDPWPYNQGYLWTTNPPSLNLPPPPPPPIVSVSGSLASNTTWTPSNIYVIPGSFTVPAGVTLNIAAGTVIKFGASTSTLDVYGTLVTLPPPVTSVADGIPKIYFTSIHDDTVGGDTNGNGNATFGSPGQYQGIIFYPNSVGTITHAVIRYGGAATAVVFNNGGTLTITNSRIVQNPATGISHLSGNLTVRDSEIAYVNFLYGIGIGGGTAVLTGNQIHDNYVGVSLGAGQLTLSSNIFSYGNVQFEAVGGSFSMSGNTFDSGYSVRIAPSANLTGASGNVLLSPMYAYDRSGSTGSGNIAWIPADYPYFIKASTGLTITYGSTLTFQPGMVLKMGLVYGPFGWTYPNINVQGNLVVNGTPSQKVYITSINDDTVGGNTYGYPHSLPAPGDFGGVIFSAGSTGSLNNVVLKYGGNDPGTVQGGIGIVGGNITIANTRIANNLFSGMNRTGGNATATFSSIHGNTNYGIISAGGGAPVSATSNWWGSASGPNHPTLNPSGTGNAVSNNVTFSPWLPSDPN